MLQYLQFFTIFFIFLYIHNIIYCLLLLSSSCCFFQYVLSHVLTFDLRHLHCNYYTFIIFQVPYAAISPFHMYVVPLATSSAHFEEASDEQLHSLSQILMRSFQRQHAVLGEPDWNLVLRSAPLRGRSTQSAYDADRFTRWHLVITPRLGGAC